MGLLWDILKSVLPRESYVPSTQLHVAKNDSKDHCKYFSGGQGDYIFDFECYSNSIFSFKIGKAFSAKDPKFDGKATPRLKIEGTNVKKRWIFNGKEYGLKKDDLWLIKIRVEKWAAKGSNSLTIYCESK